MSNSVSTSSNFMRKGMGNIKQRGDYLQVGAILCGFIIAIIFPIFLAKVAPSKEGAVIETPFQIFL
jgi:hypothetical protein